MAVDKKISQLTSLAQVDVSASTDVLPIVDTSATETKKITVSALVGAGATAGISGAVLTNGTINSTTIGATTPSTGAFTTLSASGNFTLSAGTANGVLYLDGSKVATSGTALAFDGTGFSIGAPWTTSPLRSTQPSFFQYGASGTTATLASNAGAVFQAIRCSDNAATSQFTCDKARGTYASPTAVQSGDSLGDFAFRGYGGTNLRTLARIQAAVETYTSDSDISANLTFRTSAAGGAGATEKMRLDGTGNLGLGVTPSAWSAGKAYETTAAGHALWALSNEISVTQNAYFNSGWKYGATATAARYQQQSGEHKWHIAASGTAGNAITFTQAMTLDASGNLGIGTTSPSARLQSAVSRTSGTNTTALILSDNVTGTQTSGFGTQIQGLSNNGAAVSAIGFEASGGTNNDTGIGFYTQITAGGLTRRMTITAAGNVGIGTATPTRQLSISDASQSNIQLTTTGAGGTITDGFQLQFDGSSNYVWGYENVPTLFGTNNTERMRLDASGNVGIGTTSLNAYDKVTVGGTLPSSAGNSIAYIVRGTTPSGTTSDSISFGSVFSTQAASFTLVRATHFYASQSTIGAGSTVTNQYGFYAHSNLTGATNNYGFYSDIASGSNRWNFYAAGTAQNYFAGTTTVGTTNVSPAAGNVAGVAIGSTGYVSASRSGDVAGGFNRGTNDGDIITLHQDGTTEGSISVSGNTISYNAFAGSHWSQLQDNSKPDILRGTVMEAINELCVWPDENNERLPKAKVSDTAGSKKVYGVFMTWDNDWTATNDMLITSVGAFICRVNSSVTVQEGDLLESNGDGTARVQADDIIRSSTIGKVTSTVKTHQYADGSYCVPTVLYCG